MQSADPCGFQSLKSKQIDVHVGIKHMLTRNDRFPLGMHKELRCVFKTEFEQRKYWLKWSQLVWKLPCLKITNLFWDGICHVSLDSYTLLDNYIVVLYTQLQYLLYNLPKQHVYNTVTSIPDIYVLWSILMKIQILSATGKQSKVTRQSSGCTVV